MAEPLRDDLIDEIERLPPDARARVLEFVRSLKSERARGTPGTDLARFAGTLPPADAEEMLAAVEEGRQIDHERW